LEVKGQYGQKYIVVVKHLDGKLWTQGIHLRQNNLILTSPWGLDGRSKVGR
jgi:hypothetical protein